MKTNFRKLGSLVMVVGMMSAVSVTAFGAVPASKVEMKKIVTATNSSKTVPMTGLIGKDISIKADNNNVKDALPLDLNKLEGFDVTTLKDGSMKLVNKKTGEVINVTMAAKLTDSIASTASTAETGNMQQATKIVKK